MKSDETKKKSSNATSKDTTKKPDSPVSRRDFVKASMGAAAVAPFALGSLSVARAAHVGGGDSIKVGLVGCGGRGTGAATQALKADPGAILVAMADAFEDRLESSLKTLRGNFGDKVRVNDDTKFVGFDAYQKLIDSGVDVVLLATPPAFRPAHLKAAIHANKHVFCEKPMAVDGPGVRSVIESAAEAKRRNLSLVSGFCWRYSEPQRATYGRIHDGAIGDIRAMYTTYNTGGWVAPRKREAGWSDMEAQMRSWHYFTWLSGDHIVEQACHSIDWINWAFQGRMPEKCHASGGRQTREDVPETGHVYDHFAVTYEYEDGARAFHMCRHFPNSPGDNTAYLMGSKGTCYSNPWSPSQIQISGENEWYYDGERNDMYQTEHDELFASIRDGKPMNDGEWMANSTLLAIMGRMAAYTGQVITAEQALNSQESLVPATLAWGPMETPQVAKPGETKFF